jgi:hypothetical protein
MTHERESFERRATNFARETQIDMQRYLSVASRDVPPIDDVTGNRISSKQHRLLFTIKTRHTIGRHSSRLVLFVVHTMRLATVVVLVFVVLSAHMSRAQFDGFPLPGTIVVTRR